MSNKASRIICHEKLGLIGGAGATKNSPNPDFPGAAPDGNLAPPFMGLTNDYKSCHVFDLEPATRRSGPYIVVQTGVDAEDATQQERLYLLRQDGVWVDYLTQSIHHPEARAQLCFETMAEIMALLDSLPSEARMERLPVAAARVQEFQRHVDASGGMLAFIQQEVRLLQTAPPSQA
jgi:hypothetical protein